MEKNINRNIRLHSHYLLSNIGGSGWVRDLQEAATLSPELIALFNQTKDSTTVTGYNRPPGKTFNMNCNALNLLNNRTLLDNLTAVINCNALVCNTISNKIVIFVPKNVPKFMPILPLFWEAFILGGLYKDAISALMREWGNDSAYNSAGKKALAAGYGLLVLSAPQDDQECGWMDMAVKASGAQRSARLFDT